MTQQAVQVVGGVPLVESVLAFQFVRQSKEWDSLFFGKLHDRLEADFPLVETIQGAEISLGAVPSVSAAPEIKRFSMRDGGMVVTIGPDTLGVSLLARKYSGGYPGWPTLRDTALRVFQLYRDLTAPDTLARIGVRYINSIDVEPSGFRLDRYVSEVSGIVPSSLLQEPNPFSYRIERTIAASPTHSHREILNLVARPTPSGGELVLDVDQMYFATARPDEIDVETIAEDLHRSIRSVFVRVLSAKYRKSIGLKSFASATQ